MKFIKYILLLIVVVLSSSCAYYNTLFNAQNRYDEALKKQKSVKTSTLPGDVKKNYNEAIKKCWSLIDIYGDSSKYADDALFLIGKSYYNLSEFPQAERVFEQFILKYGKSELIPESKLWLAKSYIELERDDDALNLLNGLLTQEISADIAGQAFYISGDLHFKRENYADAVENLSKSLEAAADEEILGNSHFLIGESYFKMGEYENAIDHYRKVADLDVPVLKEFDARMQETECYIKLESYAEAEENLKKMLRDIRFKPQFSLIETRLANLGEYEDNIDFAVDSYYDVMSRYKNDEGFSLSAYYLAKIYENEYADLDSANTYYSKVRNLKLHPEIEKEAKERTALLKEYLKLRDQLRKDKKDLYSLAHGDSTLEDSLVVAPDSSEIRAQNIAELQIPADEPAINSEQTGINSVQKDSSKIGTAAVPVKTIKKVAVSRTPEQVHISHRKTSFNLAEFFLLKYANYDSAASAYNDFLVTFPDDSILVPKCYYSLYYIYHDLLPDSLKADSLRSVILSRFAESSYGLKLRRVNTQTSKKQSAEGEDVEVAAEYRQAEQDLFSKKYDQALAGFSAIAVADSGKIWAQKARYAIAYLYENYLNDIDKAIEAYRLLSQEYPGTEYAKIAKNKIKLPPKEIIPEQTELETSPADSSKQVEQISEVKEEEISPEEEQKILKQKQLQKRKELR